MKGEKLMIDTFLKDLSSFSSVLYSFMNTAEERKNPDELFDSLKNLSHNVKGGAKLLKINILSELFKVLADYFDKLNSKELTFDPSQLSLLKKVQKIISIFLENKDQPLDTKELEISGETTKIIEELKLYSPKKKAASPAQLLPPQPKEKEEQQPQVDQVMFDLYKFELETQINILNNGLIDIEHAHSSEVLEILMRAAHSIKGASRVLNLTSVIQLAHAIEEIFVAAQNNELTLTSGRIDLILASLDLLSQLAKQQAKDLYVWLENEKSTLEKLNESLTAAKSTQEVIPPFPSPAVIPKMEPSISSKGANQDRVLRVTAQNLNRLMGLAGESLVESRWLQPFSNSLIKLKKDFNDISLFFTKMREAAADKGTNERINHYLLELQHKSNLFSQSLNDRLAELDMFILRYSSISDRLYREVIDSRMRPFADGVEAFPRMVRDLAKELGKKVRLEITGRSTPIDREILDKLETPLTHLLRNAIDHGLETPSERVAKGKPEEGVIKLDAQHRAGMLAITVSDDGKGVDFETLRQKVVSKNLLNTNMASQLSEQELIEFLFLPGFSTAKSVTQISGRGVGLDVVLTMVQEVSGNVRATSRKNEGMTFNLLLPLTLSVMRALMVEIQEEPYAFPLARIERALLLPKEEIHIIENKQYIEFRGSNIGLIHASQVLGLGEGVLTTRFLPIVVFSDHRNSYGVVVDKFLGERELVVHDLDPQLGKIPGVIAGALMEDGSPLLIIDVDDLTHLIDSLLSGGLLHKLIYAEKEQVARKKRVLIVEDSITVREVESRLLQNLGYEVQTAINGVDGWNALHLAEYDLVITDVDMPRMTGIELVRLIRSDPKLRNLPIMIISYKEREEDKLQGLEAGANYYLPKSSFQDQTIIKAVEDLIGKA